MSSLNKGGVTLRVKAKNFFFDRPAVVAAIGRGNTSALSKAGAFVRQSARTSIRPRKNPALASPPGSPPYAHTRDASANLRNIWFAYEPRRLSVVVGPLGLNGRGDVPALHEFGGSRQGNGRVIYVKRQAGRNAKGRFASRGADKVVLNGTLRYPKRAFMQPALNREVPKFPNLWKNSVRSK